MMNRKNAVALGLAGALALSAVTPSFAASVPTNTAAVKAAVPGVTTDVRWHGGGWRGGWGGWGWGPAVGIGLGLGLAGAYYGGYGYGCPYYDGYYCGGPYAYGYGYEPGYAYAPGPYYYGWRHRHHHWRHW
jgi:hypothetical protein